MDRDRRVLQVGEADVPAHQAFQAGVGAQGVAGAGEREHHLRRPEREDVVASKCRPRGGQPVERPGRHSVRRHEDGIERAGGRAHEQIRGDATLAQRLQHADLDSPEAAAAGEHEGGRHRRSPGTGCGARLGQAVRRSAMSRWRRPAVGSYRRRRVRCLLAAVGEDPR
jgi:hypothetical protein